MVKNFLKNNNLEGNITMALMVFILVNYNMLWNYGLAHYSFKKMIIVYPFSFILVFLVKNIVSFPMTKYIHRHQWIKRQEKLHITFPLGIIIINSLICLGLSTYLTHNYQEGYFVSSYAWYWIRTIIVALPLFFYLVRPQVRLHLSNVKKLFKAAPVES